MFLLKRKHIRLKEYDYSRAGYYFATICAKDKKCIFGEVQDDRMILNDLGRIIESCWLAIPDHFPGVTLDMFVVMPNHIHGIIFIENDGWHKRPLRRGVACNAPTTMSAIAPKSRSLPVIVRSFKSAATKCFHENGFKGVLWQPRYYDHVIRNDADHMRICEYIENNPLQWALDEENPDYKKLP